MPAPLALCWSRVEIQAFPRLDLYVSDPAVTPLAEELRSRYLLERELGRGGMATVYLARDLRHERSVALKVLHPELAHALGPERFLREIRTTARLDHPHILPVFDSGEAAGLLWYTMPYVEGESLRERLRREGQLPLDEAIRLTREVADALEYAHQHGVIHRDIKPENILLAGGHARVADFGVSQALEAAGAERLTETGLAVGTPAYMSPEQASAGPVDGRSDQYSLACMLYEMLAGEPPYTGPSAQAIIAKRFSEPVPHIRTLRSVPPELDLAVTRALGRSPADRFGTTGEFASALESPQADRGGASRQRAIRRSRVAIVALSAAAIAGVGALAIRHNSDGSSAVERIAVFPFANRTGSASLEALGSLSADWIAQAVARIPGIELVSMPPVMMDVSRANAPKAAPDSLRLVAGATTMISGSIYRIGDSVRLVAKLTDVPRHRLLVSVEATAPAASPETGVQLLAERVTTGVLASRSRDTVEMLMRSPRPPTFAAFQAFAEGMAGLDRRSSVSAFHRAVALDSTFLSPLVWLGFIYRNRGEYARADSIGSIAERKRWQLSPFEQASLDRMLAEVRGNNEEALAASRRVLAAAPTSDWAKCVTAEAALWVNRPRYALQTLKDVETRPGVYNGAAWCDLVPFQAWLMLDDGARALAAARRFARKWRQEEFWVGAGLYLQAIALARLGRTAEARDLADSAAVLDPEADPGYAMNAGHELRSAGDRGGAQVVFERRARSFRGLPDTASLAEAGEALYWAGSWDEASAVFRQLAAHPKYVVRAHGVFGVLAARRENLADARAADAWLSQVNPRHRRGEVSVWRARIAAALGEQERAVELLQQAFVEGQTQDYFGMYSAGMSWFRTDPHFDSLRDFPPFVALMRPKG
jgi:serine/threonine protein kinase/tetratricopeptide (TPR) repeat protein